MSQDKTPQQSDKKIEQPEHHESASSPQDAQDSPVNYYSEKPLRAPVAWYGGKAKYAKWIIGHFPDHRVFIEPFGGAGNILLSKHASEVEIYNDLDHRVVNFFNVLRDPEQFGKLVKMASLTPYSREQFASLAERLEPEDPVEQAWWFYVRCRQARGGLGMSDLTSKSWGISTRTRRQMAEPVSKYLSGIDGLDAVVERMRTVVIECLPALGLIRKHDGTDVFYYCDPPYMASTRNGKKAQTYAHEMSDKDHEQLLRVIKNCKAKVMISGYDSPLYKQSLSSWRREQKVVRSHLSNSGQSRLELLWMNW